VTQQLADILNGHAIVDCLGSRRVSDHMGRDPFCNTLTAIRQNKPISTKSIDVLCRLLQCQPGDILMYENDATDRK